MVREFQNEDREAIFSLFVETFNGPPWNDKWSYETAEKYLTEFIETPGFTGCTLIENDQIIGVAFAQKRSWWSGSELYINELWVKPDRQRSGYGVSILKFLENHAKLAGCTGALLLTNRNYSAKLFYEKCNYSELEQMTFMHRDLE